MIPVKGMLLRYCSFRKLFTAFGEGLSSWLCCSSAHLLYLGDSGDCRAVLQRTQSQDLLDLNRRTNGSWCESPLFCKMENVITAFVT